MKSTIRLRAEKGTRTWCGKIKNNLFETDMINGHWGKEKGILEFSADEGYYITHNYSGKKYIEVYSVYSEQLEQNILTQREVKKEDVIKSFIKDLKMEKRDFCFDVISYAPNNVAYDMSYKPVGDVFFTEDENYYYISGTFNKSWKRYIRNFTCVDQRGEKEETLNEKIYSKIDDNIKIVFLDQDRIEITKPVYMDENSIITKGVHPDFVGIYNP